MEKQHVTTRPNAHGYGPSSCSGRGLGATRSQVADMLVAGDLEERDVCKHCGAGAIADARARLEEKEASSRFVTFRSVR